MSFRLFSKLRNQKTKAVPSEPYMDNYTRDKLKETMLKLARNEIRISYYEAENALSACDSKIGGKPAVPQDFVWPRYAGESCDNVTKERPLSFMAQINLEDVKIYDTDHLLPNTGMLSFFYEQISMSWGLEPEDEGSAKVYYFPNTEKLMPMDFPADMDAEAMISELAVDFESHISIPAFEDFPDGLMDTDLNPEDYDECREECGYAPDECGDFTKLLGYPDTVQSCMDEPESILLFQMGTIETEDTEWMFGDCGHIYYWIRKQDLTNQNFDNTRFILQSS